MHSDKNNGIYLKSAAEIATMRRTGYILERVLREVCAAAVEGTTTLELDKLAYNRIREAKARPGFLGQYGFPNTLCISVNEAVVHGIPNKRKLKEGDLVSIDCGVVVDGYWADSAWTVGVGKISNTAQRLLAVTREALFAGIGAAKVGGRVSDIGAAVEKVVHAAGFHITDNHTGHGVGRELHEEPKVYNTAHPRGPRISPGLTVAIEPMINIGTSKTKELADQWTVVTLDGSLSAHMEHTIAVTNEGVELLTFSGEYEY